MHLHALCETEEARESLRQFQHLWESKRAKEYGGGNISYGGGFGSNIFGSGNAKGGNAAGGAAGSGGAAGKVKEKRGVFEKLGLRRKSGVGGKSDG